MMPQFKIKRVIEESDWNTLVRETYGIPYNFQQQDDCRNRGLYNIYVPEENPFDFPNDSVPEIVNGSKMGVSFAAWLARDPKKPLEGQKYDWDLNMWYDRNFYPSVEMVANDMHKKGLLGTGEFSINVDW